MISDTCGVFSARRLMLNDVEHGVNQKVWIFNFKAK